MSVKQYLNILPDSLNQTDVTEAWGNRQIKEWIKKNIPLDKILWGRTRTRTQDKSEPATRTTPGREATEPRKRADFGVKEKKGTLPG